MTPSPDDSHGGDAPGLIGAVDDAVGEHLTWIGTVNRALIWPDDPGAPTADAIGALVLRARRLGRLEAPG